MDHVKHFISHGGNRFLEVLWWRYYLNCGVFFDMATTPNVTPFGNPRSEIDRHDCKHRCYYESGGLPLPSCLADVCWNKGVAE